MFKREYLLGLLALILVVGSTILAQPKTTNTPKHELVGKWELDAGSTSGFFESLVIIRKDSEFSITSEVTDSLGGKSSETIIYYADGRGEKNEFVLPYDRPWRMDKTKVKTKTKWKGENLVSSGSYDYGDGSGSRQITEQWELSEDGKMLIRKASVKIGGANSVRNLPGSAENNWPATRATTINVFRASPPVETVLKYRRVN